MRLSLSADAFTNLCAGRGKAQPCNPVLIISALPANLYETALLKWPTPWWSWRSAWSAHFSL